MIESHAIIQDLQLSVSRAQENTNYWQREADRWKYIAQEYFRLWYLDSHALDIPQEDIEKEVTLFYAETFEDN